jgi:hypothetical protein
VGLDEGKNAGSELRVPTHATEAEVRCRDGRSFLGRVFIPGSSSHHSGTMRVDEWMNEGGSFFPFLPDDSTSVVLLNRDQVAILAVAPRPETDGEPVEPEPQLPKQHIAVELGDRRLQGEILLDMPQTQRRVLDYLNRHEPFLLLRTTDRWFLVRKSMIARVVEIQEG